MVREPCPVHCHGLCVTTRHTGPDFLQARASTSRSYLYAPCLLHSQLISEICASFWNDLSESPVGGICVNISVCTEFLDHFFSCISMLHSFSKMQNKRKIKIEGIKF